MNRPKSPPVFECGGWSRKAGGLTPLSHVRGWVLGVRQSVCPSDERNLPETHALVCTRMALVPAIWLTSPP